MNSPVAEIIPAIAHPIAHPIVLQPRLLDRAQSLQFQDVLHNALHQAAAVIVDFIWISAIDPAGIAVLKNALNLAVRLGKSIAFQGADANLSLLLAQESDRLRSGNLGVWQPQCHAEFNEFLRDRSDWQPESATIPDGEIVFPRFGLAIAKTA